VIPSGATFLAVLHFICHSCFEEESITVVSRIYASRFATLALVESVGGAYMQDLTFYLAPLPVPRLDADIGTLYDRLIEAADLRCPRY